MWEESTLEIENLDVDLLALYIGKHLKKDALAGENLLEVVYTKCLKKHSVKKKKVSKKNT